MWKFLMLHEIMLLWTSHLFLACICFELSNWNCRKADEMGQKATGYKYYDQEITPCSVSSHFLLLVLKEQNISSLLPTGEIILLGEYFWKSSRKGTSQTFLYWLRKGCNPGASFEHQIAAGVVQIVSQELVFTLFACCSSHLIVLVQKMERWVNPQDC